MILRSLHLQTSLLCPGSEGLVHEKNWLPDKELLSVGIEGPEGGDDGLWKQCKKPFGKGKSVKNGECVQGSMEYGSRNKDQVDK